MGGEAPRELCPWAERQLGSGGDDRSHGHVQDGLVCLSGPDVVDAAASVAVEPVEPA
jgi:hypothetical protein